MSKHDAYGEEAERLFVEKGMTLAQIARTLPVSVQTLVAWRRKYRWDQKRAKFLAQPVSITDKLRELLERRIDRLFEKMEEGGEVSDAEIDAITKLVASIKKIEKEVDLTSAAPLVMKAFAQFLVQRAREDPELEPLKEQFGNLVPAFMDALWKKYRRAT